MSTPRHKSETIHEWGKEREKQTHCRSVLGDEKNKNKNFTLHFGTWRRGARRLFYRKAQRSTAPRNAANNKQAHIFFLKITEARRSTPSWHLTTERRLGESVFCSRVLFMNRKEVKNGSLIRHVEPACPKTAICLKDQNTVPRVEGWLQGGGGQFDYGSCA